MATLVYSDADGIDKQFSLGADPIVVGRSAECAIRSQDPRVSRMHARFYVDQGQLWVEDLGSSNGIYVGPNKVQRAPVPIGEIVLVGSLMIRLLPASGTLPPPMGLHGTLASWLDMERKARAGIEGERDAFAKRVGELHEELRTLRTAGNAHGDDAAKVREELDALRKQTAKDLEALKLELAKARDAKIAAETQVGMTVAEKLAEADMTISKLEYQLEQARSQASAPKDTTLADQVTMLTGRVDKAERELATAQIRAQGAERDLAAAKDKLAQLSNVEERMAAARKEQEVARDRSTTAEVRIQEAAARIDDAEQRASAADTMAKAMAKDVAEALRRAVDADMRARGLVRELDGAHRRAESAEKRDAERLAATNDAERRATEAEGRLEEVRKQLTEKLEQTQKELASKSDATTKDMLGKLEQAQRELAAERSSGMSLVERKTQLERELNEARTTLAGLQHRVELAEGKVTEYEVQVDQLEERIQDLESGIAVEQTASRSVSAEARDRVARLEEQLHEARAAAKTSTKTAAGLERRIEALEIDLSNALQAREMLEAELANARGVLEEAGTHHDRAAAAERRVAELESTIEPLAARAEAGELAVGRASALQRQLEEALQKLAWLERDGSHHDDLDPGLAAAQVAAAEDRARDAEIRTREAEQQAQQYANRMREVEQRSKEIEDRAKAIEARAKEAAERIVDSERRGRDAQTKLEDAQHRLAEAQVQVTDLQRRLADAEARVQFDDVQETREGHSELERELDAARERIEELKREVDSAENVRQFAATTEREIAGLQRELRELKAKIAQVTMERDRLESQLRDIRDDSETRDRRAIQPRAGSAMDPESTFSADVSRYTALVAHASELERRLADAEGQLAAQRRARDEEPTKSGGAVPMEFAEHLAVLEESIDSLRADMRAASDETAMMEQTDSVVVVASAVSSAAEHVERARDSLRALTRMVRP